MAPDEISKQPAAGGGKWEVLRQEWIVVLGLISGALFLLFGNNWLTDLSSNPWRAVGLFFWLTTAVLIAAFGVVRHADCLAIKLGEPYGTLILTLSVIGMEVLLVSAVMLSGKGDPAMARDTMFAVVMIVLNGLLGVSLLAGGLRHREQQYNLQGAASYLAMLVPLSATGLILPYYTVTSNPMLLKFRILALLIATLGLYGAFLAVQTRRHPEHYYEPLNDNLSAQTAEAEEHGHFTVRSLSFHVTLLLLFLMPVVVLSKKLAIILDYGGRRIGAPQALAGVVVAVLILCPEGVSGIRAALGNRLQRSVNLLFGAALSTIALTVPAVAIISLTTGQAVQLGLDPVNQILLATTLIVCILTCATGRTNVLNGLVHLVLFFTYFVLIFGD